METTDKKLSLQWFVLETTWLGHYSDHGWGNGYVCLPPTHPCFGMDYPSINNKYEIDVHGGLTFARNSNDLRGKGWGGDNLPDGEWWIIGFDTAHAWDSMERWPKETVERETTRLMQQLDAITNETL